MKIFQRLPRRPSKVERLLEILSDYDWHDTKELVRKVGHTFLVSKWRLEGYRYHYTIEKRRHPTEPFQWQYRLVKDPTEPGKRVTGRGTPDSLPVRQRYAS